MRCDFSPIGGILSENRSHLSRVQLTRKWHLRLASLTVAPVLLLVAPYAHPDGMVAELIKLLGIALILIAVAGRTWCTLYIGRKKREILICIGPYSLSRNPLYLFSLVGALGIGLATGSVLMGLLLSSITFLVLSAVVRHEEREMNAKFGAAYRTYLGTTPRWLALTLRWRDAERIDVSPALVLRTFRDSSLMLLCLPVFEVVEAMRETSVMPTVLRLP